MGTLRITPFVLGIGLGCLLFLQSCGNNKPSKSNENQAEETQINNRYTEKGNLEVGYAIGLGRITKDTLALAKSVGIDHIEISGLSSFVAKDRSFKATDQEIIQKLKAVKNAADSAGVNIWSIHMPFGSEIDLSLLDENQRIEVVKMHQKLLEHLSILEPDVVLFHPSYYLGLEQRGERAKQLIKSAKALDKDVRSIGATLVIENMLGPKLLLDQNRERPLLRTVEESVTLFSRLPETIGLAVDTNHILYAEELILALGDRLKTLHIADGTGEAENHWFPCDYKGKNNWNKVLSALEKVDYNGPFMYESKAKELSGYQDCYQELYSDYMKNKM